MTDQRIVAEFELPSGSYSRMSISVRKVHEHGIALDQAGSFFQIGNPDAAMENIVLFDNVASLAETQLTNLPIIATAKVTITGDKWRIEVTEAPGDSHYVGVYPLHFNITVFSPLLADEGCGCDAFYQVSVTQSYEDPPADDGDGGALTNVDDPPDPDDLTPPPEGDGADPPANGGALTNVDDPPDPDDLIPPPDGDGADPPANGGAGALTNVEGPPDPAPAKSILQQHIDLANTPIFADGWRPVLQKVITSEAQSGRLDAGDLDIGGGAQQKASDDGAHRSSYHLYYDAEGGSYYLRFDDARTADLPISATAAQVDAALEGLAGVTSAEVTGEPGDLTIALTADEPHILQWSDLNLNGDGGLDYLMA